MRYATLGGSGIHVPRICIGTMTFGNPLTEEECERLVSAALDLGINFFDTADVYEGYDRSWGSHGGVSETILGKTLKGRRHRAVICTKFGNPAGTGPLDAGLSTRHLERQLESSLRRLQTDHVDVFLAHRWHGGTAMEDFLRVCERWVQSGKVRAVGSSNWPVWRITQAAELAHSGGGPPLRVASPKYNLMRRGPELEQAACNRHYGIAMVPYQPLEAGVLSGKYRRGHEAPAGSRGNEKPGWIPKLEESQYQALEALGRLAGEAGATMAEYSVAWVLSRPGVASAILGIRNEEQLQEAVRAVALTLPPHHQAQLDALFPPPSPMGDERILQWRDSGWVLEASE
ncbi:MAG: aldo/keto reductase [Bryobacteraceae bacterium]